MNIYPGKHQTWGKLSLTVQWNTMLLLCREVYYWLEHWPFLSRTYYCVPYCYQCSNCQVSFGRDKTTWVHDDEKCLCSWCRREAPLQTFSSIHIHNLLSTIKQMTVILLEWGVFLGRIVIFDFHICFYYDGPDFYMLFLGTKNVLIDCCIYNHDNNRWIYSYILAL